VAPAIATDEVLQAGARLRELLAAWRDARDLIEIDAYVPGTNPLVDRAVELRQPIDAFLRQPVGEISSLPSTVRLTCMTFCPQSGGIWLSIGVPA